MQNDQSIGALSRRTGVKVATVRFYEEIGLLPKAVRTESNRRIYDETAVQRLTFIRHARELGFEIPAIRKMLDLADQPQRPCAEVDGIARGHLRDIDSRIERLMALRGEVSRMLDDCGRNVVADCRILEVLGHHEFCQHAEH
jgi:DNA-binding transcriptional MerR regulator